LSTAAGKRHMGRVAACGCILCIYLGLGETPAEVHHMKEETGACDRPDDWLTIPLCVRHHKVEYPDSIHRLKKAGFYRRYKVSELDLLAMTLARIYGGLMR
jgi:hypothetical protein